MGKLIDLTGKEFGRWRVVRRGALDSTGKPLWLCKCECGVEKEVTGNNLRQGKTVSCGCYHSEVMTKHGMHRSPEYKVWHAMIERCTNKNSCNFKNYGDRGISVCDRWRKFENFISDMGQRPAGRMTLERKDNSLGYSPENCKWATYEEQAVNRRNTHRIEYHGLIQSVKEWSMHLCVNESTFRGMVLRLGGFFAIERALENV